MAWLEAFEIRVRARMVEKDKKKVKRRRTYDYSLGSDDPCVAFFIPPMVWGAPYRRSQLQEVGPRRRK
jgi:hypothetical protein